MSTRRSDLRSMVQDSVAFSSMVGFGESYFPAFALALGFGSVTAGLIASLPMLFGSVLQLVTPAAVGLLNSHRRWVVLCAGLQAASFIPLIAGALAGEMQIWVLYLAVSLYWGLGMSTGPAWTAWATTLVPIPLRARFFARRAAAGQAALVVALLASGAVLQNVPNQKGFLTAFAVIFALAMTARATSTCFLARQSEPLPVPIGESRISPTAIRQHIHTGGHGRLLVFLLSFQLSVWVAAPFFTPYMLGHLGLSYIEYTLLTMSAFVARVIALPRLGPVIQRKGTKKVLVLASLGIVPLPLFWIVSDSFWWLLLLQLWGGIVWAAFELASFLSFFERIPAHGQTSVLTVYNLANAGAILMGSVLGATLLDWAPSSEAGFIAVLCISAFARAAALPLLRRVENMAKPGRIPALRTLSVRPSSGALQRPVVTTFQEEE